MTLIGRGRHWITGTEPHVAVVMDGDNELTRAEMVTVLSIGPGVWDAADVEFPMMLEPFLFDRIEVRDSDEQVIYTQPAVTWPDPEVITRDGHRRYGPDGSEIIWRISSTGFPDQREETP